MTSIPSHPISSTASPGIPPPQLRCGIGGTAQRWRSHPMMEHGEKHHHLRFSSVSIASPPLSIPSHPPSGFLTIYTCSISPSLASHRCLPSLTRPACDRSGNTCLFLTPSMRSCVVRSRHSQCYVNVKTTSSTVSSHLVRRAMLPSYFVPWVGL